MCGQIAGRSEFVRGGVPQQQSSVAASTPAWQRPPRPRPCLGSGQCFLVTAMYNDEMPLASDNSQHPLERIPPWCASGGRFAADSNRTSKGSGSPSRPSRACGVSVIERYSPRVILSPANPRMKAVGLPCGVPADTKVPLSRSGRAGACLTHFPLAAATTRPRSLGT